MGTEWREAKSLKVLEAEIQQHYPGTTTWEIGDDDHQANWSDHNPNAKNVVCAKDILPDGGIDLGKLCQYLVTRPHPNLRYVIFNRKIYQRKNGFEAEDYTGRSAHKRHLHASVGNGPDGRSTSGYDSTAPWGIEDMDKAPAKPQVPSKPKPSTSNLGEKMPTRKRGDRGRSVRILQALLNAWGWKVRIDGTFGPQTERAVRQFQDKYANPVDGIVGELTWTALLGLD